MPLVQYFNIYRVAREAQDEAETLERKQRILQQGLRDRAIKLSWTDPAVSALEAAISRGDRRAGSRPGPCYTPPSGMGV